MLETILKVLEAGLTVWASHEKTKYQDKFYELKMAYQKEYNKPEHLRSDAVLDNIRSELCILCDSFSATVGGANSPHKP